MSHTCAITALLLLFSRWGIFVNKISLSQCLSRLWYPQLNTLIAGHFLLRTAGSYSIGCKLNNPKATEVASRLKLLPDLVRDALKREEEVKAWAKGVLTNLRLSLSLSSSPSLTRASFYLYLGHFIRINMLLPHSVFLSPLCQYR
jgi:hypothetical protein